MVKAEWEEGSRAGVAAGVEREGLRSSSNLTERGVERPGLPVNAVAAAAGVPAAGRARPLVSRELELTLARGGFVSAAATSCDRGDDGGAKSSVGSRSARSAAMKAASSAVSADMAGWSV